MGIFIRHSIWQQENNYQLELRSDIAMIRIILVLSLLNLAISSKIPIHKQIVGSGGEKIDVNIEVNIDLPEDDTTGEEFRRPGRPTIEPRLPTIEPRLPTRQPRLPTRQPRLPTRQPITYETLLPTKPTCLKTGEACAPSAPSADKKCCPLNLCDLDNLKCVRVQEHPDNPLVS